ncbi:hypothetical protein A9Q84_14375 [Halobacteriovorax marinus]|uniref:Solute-binding protein family 3/N-terminal domain-containing protein n=1 Tax=Halobacteriovorax marinus TaxID=97084 RepID=A0A1Y5FA98_9BACT|nr:hypothetical protein A9Q84_14375 [Halobacteriovorax marinus]
MKNIIEKFSLFLVAILLICKANAIETGKLKAAIFHIAPWGYVNSNKKVVGIEYDIIKAISSDINEEIEVVLVPYKRMISMLEHGDADFSIFFRSEKSENVGIPLVKWGELDIIVIGLKNNHIRSYSDLSNQRIAVRLGGYFDDRFDQDQSLRKITYANYADGIKSLKKIEVTAIVGTAATLYYEFKKQGISISELGQPFLLSHKEDWLHFSKLSKRANKQRKIKNSVKKLIENGTFNEIFSTYLPKEWEHKK